MNILTSSEVLDKFYCRISEPSADPEDLELLSPDEREKRRSFEAKRTYSTLGLVDIFKSG